MCQKNVIPNGFKISITYTLQKCHNWYIIPLHIGQKDMTKK